MTVSRYDQWKLAEPDEPETPERTCGECLFCKDVRRLSSQSFMYVGTCVREVFEASDVKALTEVDVTHVSVDEEACDHWIHY